MKTGSRGTFVISWDQTEVDGATGAPVRDISVGITWRWTGSSVRVDAPRDVLVLENAIDTADLHRRAAQNVRRLVASAQTTNSQQQAIEDDERLFNAGFDLTDGSALYRVTLIDVWQARLPMLMFVGRMPPQDQELWVVDCNMDSLAADKSDASGHGVICFIPGTRIATPNGARPVEDLAEGDQVSTKDNGDQPIRWIGNRRMSGARLLAMPHLRPIRLRANILGQGEPNEDLLVSPDHRILLQGPTAEALFNTPEVLVAARDLLNDRSITVDHTLREVTYIHLMLDQHQIVWANGVESESFHPAGAQVDQIGEQQRQRLFELFPGVGADPYHYGDFARRNLSAPEAAILTHGGLLGH